LLYIVLTFAKGCSAAGGLMNEEGISIHERWRIKQKKFMNKRYFEPADNKKIHCQKSKSAKYCPTPMNQGQQGLAV
jgi:hypothetical protein